MTENLSPITATLIEKSKGLLQIEPEINDWTGKNFQMFNGGSVEVEVAEFLYAMVRLIKPLRVLDLGSHFGVSALYMAQACSDNDFGVVTSVEHNKWYAEQAMKLWHTSGLYINILPVEGSSLKFEPALPYDLILSDTEPEIRFEEVVRFFPQLNPGGYLFVHDLPRGFCVGNINPDHPEIANWPYGGVPKQMNDWLKDGEMVKWHFETPRSLTGFYKSRPDDYKLWT